MPSRGSCLSALAMLVLLGSGAARPLVAQELDALYDAAKADLSAKRYPVALLKCGRALAGADVPVETRWKFWLVAAIAHERQAEPQAALAYYHRFLNGLATWPAALSTPWRERERGITQVVERLQAEQLTAVGALTLASSPPGARISVDGVAAGPDGREQTPATLYLPPGPHEVRLEREGSRPADLPVLVRRGRVEELSVALAPQEPPVVDEVGRTSDGARPLVTPLVPAPSPEPAEPPPLARMAAPAPSAPFVLEPLWGWVMLGSGAAVALAGVPCTVLAGQDHDALAKLAAADPNDPANQQRHADLSSGMEAKQIAAGVLYGVGAAGVVAGATWLILGAASPATGHGATGPATSVGVLPTPGGAVVTFGGRW